MVGLYIYTLKYPICPQSELGRVICVHEWLLLIFPDTWREKSYVLEEIVVSIHYDGGDGDNILNNNKQDSLVALQDFRVYQQCDD